MSTAAADAPEAFDPRREPASAAPASPTTDQRCPACGNANRCQVRAARAGGHCWCFDLRARDPDRGRSDRPAGRRTAPSCPDAQASCLCEGCLRARHVVVPR